MGKPKHYIGLMSGTSLDGIDCVLTTISHNSLVLNDTYFHEFEPTLRQQITSLFTPSTNAIATMGHLDVELGRRFAHSVNALLKKNTLRAADITAIGSHGQTIRHHPHGSHPFSFQIGDPNIIAQQTGIATVTDFRRKDIALGGQGAPLAPAFHEFLFQKRQHGMWIVNIGGISNLTYLPPNRNDPVIGFDCGPGNALLDAHFQLHHPDTYYDHDGHWAKSGTPDTLLLNRMLLDPFFQQAPPKSTGKERFNLDWVNRHLNALREPPQPHDLQRTLLELTCSSVLQAIKQADRPATTLCVCGGGAKNTFLMSRLKDSVNLTVNTSADYDMPPEWLEASAFAWLASRHIDQSPIPLQHITGATQDAILGALWPP